MWSDSACRRKEPVISHPSHRTRLLLVVVSATVLACTPTADPPTSDPDTEADATDDSDDRTGGPADGVRGGSYDGDAGEVDSDRLDVQPAVRIPEEIAAAVDLPAAFTPETKTVATGTGAITIDGTLDEGPGNDRTIASVAADLEAALAAGDFDTVEVTVDTDAVVSLLAVTDGGNAGLHLFLTVSPDSGPLRLQATWFDLPAVGR